MEYSISEASRILNITRVTVYKKIDKIEGIQGHIQTRGKSKYINDEGIELIKKSLSNNCKEYTQENIQVVNTCTNNEDNSKDELSNEEDSKVYTDMQSDIQSDIQSVNTYTTNLDDNKEELSNKEDAKVYTPIQQDIQVEYVNSLKEQILDLKTQLNVKDNQLESKDEQLQAKDRQLETLAKLNENNQILLKHVQEKVFLLESGNEPEHQEQQEQSNQVDILTQSIKELQDKINLIESEKKKKFKWKFWKN